MGISASQGTPSAKEPYLEGLLGFGKQNRYVRNINNITSRREVKTRKSNPRYPFQKSLPSEASFPSPLGSAKLCEFSFVRSYRVAGNKKHFEIERKFRLTETEFAEMPERLHAAGFHASKTVVENDTFFPVEKKGDMLRLRDETCDETTIHTLTRKTWVETAGQKERSESEEEISEFIREFMLEVVQRVHSQPLRRLRKDRSLYKKEGPALQGEQVTVTLDYLKELGEYSGPYMEIELIVDNDSGVQRARDYIQKIAAQLLHEERDYVRMSYQDMLNAIST
ncbi:MAG TPA: CYTH domain-containing protein [Oculatellaceae cyanobacterium]